MQKQNKKLNKNGTSTSIDYKVPAGASILVLLYIVLLAYRSAGQKYVWRHACGKHCCSDSIKAVKPKRIILKPCESNNFFSQDTYYYE